MRSPTLPTWSIVRWSLALTLAAGAVVSPASDPPAATEAAAGVVGPGACAECHASAHEVWQASTHFTNSKTLSRSDEAKAIGKALGIRRIKADERCTSCHFTLQSSDSGRIKATTGVSCESCHGPAADWLDPHADFGPDASNAEEESEAHRLERRRRCREAGLVSPRSVYELGARCYSCHSIDDSELVTAGGHPTGAGFELVAWSQGEIRHNFHQDGSGENTESPVERRALMYVVGRALELEHALLALERATPERGVELRARLDAAAADVARILELATVPALAELAALASGGSTPAPEALRALGARTESELGAVDLTPLFDLLPGEESYVGRALRR